VHDTCGGSGIAAMAGLSLGFLFGEAQATFGVFDGVKAIDGF
jgi:hypothetical protein